MQLPDFSACRVLVYGDLMLDRYWHGGTTRISPEAPVPIVKVKEIEERAGGAANVALNASALGAQVVLTGIVGTDESAKTLMRLLGDAGIRNQVQMHEDARTITKLRIISRHQQLIRLDFEEDADKVLCSEDLTGFKAALSSCDVVVLSDYGKGALDKAVKFIDLANASGKKVLVDPKGTNFSKYANATLLTPNQAEFDAIVGECRSDEEFFLKGQELLHELSLEALLVTRSEKGMALFQQSKEPLILPTRVRDVYDVTGAGDTVISTLAIALASGEGLEESTQLANLAAGVVVGKFGTAITNVQELQQAAQGYGSITKGVVEEAELKRLISAAQKAGETVVMTNGCFDLLHSGHVKYLNEAASLGDKLIVAVNSDDSVKALKGDKRPINGVQQRMAVLSALESVDWVVEFGDSTPASLISKCLPDVLVKGGDYKPEEIVGADVVIANGGLVEVLGFFDGVSTTKIVNTLQEYSGADRVE